MKLVVSAAFGIAAALCLAALPAHAQYITTSRTIAGGNPLNGNYTGQSQFFGINSNQTRVNDLRADIIDPAQFSYNDQTGGGLGVFSNSIVTVQGGTFGQVSSTGFGGGLSLRDTSQATISGGTIQIFSLSGTGAGTAGAQATVSGGLIQNSLGGVVSVTNGKLDVTGGTIRANSGQTALIGSTGSIINISGGTVASTSGVAISIGGGSALTVSGGAITGVAGSPNGIVINNATIAAVLTGGTINGLRAARSNAATLDVQAVVSGTATINGGVFATGNAGIDILGGTFNNYSSGASAAAFLALGSNTINFYGTNLAFSAPTAGSVFFVNSLAGNFFTFTSGVLRDGQDVTGKRLFVSNTAAASGGGSTLNVVTSAPEPSSLALFALPFLVKMISRRRKSH